jgi:hypothetical protein
MDTVERLFDDDDVDPIDIVETLAEHYDWDFDRITEDQIAMTIEGSWRTYAVTLSWGSFDETLRIICSFDMSPPKEKFENLMEVINLANNRCWSGSFMFAPKQKLMIFKYGLNLIGGARASAIQIDSIVENAIVACERFYPAFQLTCWGEETAEDSMAVAFEHSYGRA